MKPKTWKHFVITLFILGLGIGAAAVVVRRVFAEERQHARFRRVENITLDPSDCSLRWVVNNGVIRDGKFVPKGPAENYQIDFHMAQMTHDGATRKFSEQEAVRVHQVVVAISHYAAESVEWFEQQGGVAG